MENKTMDLLNDMAQTVLTEIFGYGRPDGSDYSEYMLKPADSYFEKIESCPEPSLLEELLCWSMYEAVNIHNAECKVFESQQKLEAMIFQQFGTECGNVDNIKYNRTLLDSMHNESKDILDDKVQHFISYCMFADKEFILNGNPYWRQINLAVLEKIYKDSLNFNSSQRWYFPSRFFMMGDGSPRSIGPDFTEGPEYQWNEKENRLEANIYLPMSDEFKGISTDVNPVLANISIEEVCDWAHLDFIIKCEVDNTDCSKLYLANQTRSARRGVYNLFSLILGNKAEEQENIETLVINIFRDLFWVWMEDDLPKPETGYMETKPAVIYCLYRTLPFLTREACDAIFQTNINSNLNDEYLRFMEIKAGGEPLPMYLQLGEHHLHQREEKFGNHIRELTDEENAAGEKMKDEIFKEKYSIFSMMLYFLFWDIAKNTPTESGVNEDSLMNFFGEHCNLMERFYEPFVDETWNKEPLPDSEERRVQRRINATWIKEETLVELFNLIMKNYRINSEISNIKITPFETSDIEVKTEILKVLLFNFSILKNKSKDLVLNVMDFVGELKDRRDLYCQPKKGQKFKTEDDVSEKISKLKENQSLLKKIDCGFEINNHIQCPVPGNNYNLRENLLSRKLTCRFFSDTDKEYSYKVQQSKEKCSYEVQQSKEKCSYEVQQSKKRYSIGCNENRRQTNKNNFYCKSLYVSERNTARHYVDAYSIRNILEYPNNLLEAFRDAKDFLLELQESKKDSQTESIIITYQYDFIERHLIEYVEKFNLLEGKTVVKENIWNDIFTNDKNIKEEIKQKLSDFYDHYSILGEKYMERIKWFFKILYCVEPHFINVYFPSIAAYLTYLTLRIKDYVY